MKTTDLLSGSEGTNSPISLWTWAIAILISKMAG